MAGESCNLDKDEAEIFKPSSSAPSASPPSPPPPSSAPPPPPPSLSSPLHLKSCEESNIPREESNIPRPESPPLAPIAVSSSPKLGEDPPKACEEPRTPVRFGNRCSTCQRKVGLTGFRCRCGDLFCGRHRYSDAHDCSFDYKAAGREEIAKANPLIKAAKIIKI